MFVYAGFAAVTEKLDEIIVCRGLGFGQLLEVLRSAAPCSYAFMLARATVLPLLHSSSSASSTKVCCGDLRAGAGLRIKLAGRPAGRHRSGVVLVSGDGRAAAPVSSCHQE
jgi:hypothetical protein